MKKQTSTRKTAALKTKGEKGTPLTEVQMARLETLAAGDPIVICKGQQIPAGWVIVAEGSSINCPGNFPNTWTIKRPGATEVGSKCPGSGARPRGKSPFGDFLFGAVRFLQP